MAGAQARDGSEIRHPDWRIQMVLDVGFNADDLPCGQAALHQGFWRVSMAGILIALGLDQRRCAGDAGSGGVAIVIDRFTSVIEKPEHYRGEASVLGRLLRSDPDPGGERRRCSVGQEARCVSSVGTRNLVTG
jgi:hypothetical protein